MDGLKAVLVGSTEPDILLFIHGYNVSFAEALRRTGQLAYDLNFPGVLLLYSWPSQGRPLSYMVDETNIAWTRPNFQAVLEILLSKVGARNVDVVAHSMGSRALVHAIASINAGLPVGTASLHHVVLAAPDIDADEFRGLSIKLTGRSHRLTLYASSRDRALQVSKRVHGYSRAGESGDTLLVIPDLMDT